MTAFGPNNDLKNLFRDLEKKAKPYPLQSYRISGDTGLLLLQKTIAPKNVEKALSALTSNSDAETMSPSIYSGLHDQIQFKDRLITELERVERTRLPCSLILVAIDNFASLCKKHGAEHGKIASQHLANIIKNHIHKVDTLARYDANTFSILLPGSNLGKSLQRAKQLKKAIKKKPLKIDGTQHSQTASLCVATCQTYDNLSPDSFLDTTVKKLIETSKKGVDKISHVPNKGKEDSCQVTVEERAQLFGFLAKG